LHGHVREEVVAGVVGGGDEAALTEGSGVLFQGQIYSQYRDFVESEEMEFVVGEVMNNIKWALGFSDNILTVRV
jgi:hypothetical protein